MSDMLRISGIASGMDTETMVKKLMEAEQIKVDRLEQQKTSTVWRQEAYHEMNIKMANFVIDTKTEFGLSSTSSYGDVVNYSVDSVDWIKSATSSDTDSVGVSATTNAVSGSYDFKVHNIAETFSTASTAAITTGSGIASLADMFSTVNEADEIKFTIASKKMNRALNSPLQVQIRLMML